MVSLKDMATVFGIDTAGITNSPDLGLTANIDMEPGISNADTMETMFQMPDIDTPAVDANPETVTDLLRQIRNNTDPGDNSTVWYPYVQQLTAAAGEASIRIPTPFKHVFVHKVPRDMDVYAGSGRAFFLGTVTAGHSLRAQYPFPMDGVTLVWGAGAGSDYVAVTLSSEKFDVEII